MVVAGIPIRILSVLALLFRYGSGALCTYLLSLSDLLVADLIGADGAPARILSVLIGLLRYGSGASLTNLLVFSLIR